MPAKNLPRARVNSWSRSGMSAKRKAPTAGVQRIALKIPISRCYPLCYFQQLFFWSRPVTGRWLFSNYGPYDVYLDEVTLIVSRIDQEVQLFYILKNSPLTIL